jgi:excisionase family DNA binding protein
MITVPEAARRVGRSPETIRRWIRAGRLRSQKVGTQHLIDEQELEELLAEDDMLPLPEEWRTMRDGRPQPNWVKIIREGRASH